MGNLTDHFSGGGGGSNILEFIKFQADGRVISTLNGDVTTQNVTSNIQATTSWAVLPGSVFAYTPPDDTKYVSYRIITNTYHLDANNIGHFSLALDGTRITNTQNGFYCTGNYQEQWISEGTIAIDSSYTEDVAAGKLASWTSDKTLAMYFRTYSNTSYEYYANDVYYQNGGGSSGEARSYKPHVEIISYK